MELLEKYGIDYPCRSDGGVYSTMSMCDWSSFSSVRHFKKASDFFCHSASVLDMLESLNYRKQLVLLLKLYVRETLIGFFWSSSTGPACSDDCEGFGLLHEHHSHDQRKRERERNDSETLLERNAVCSLTDMINTLYHSCCDKGPALPLLLNIQ